MNETSLSAAMLHNHIFGPEKKVKTTKDAESRKWPEIQGKARSKQNIIMEVCQKQLDGCPQISM